MQKSVHMLYMYILLSWSWPYNHRHERQSSIHHLQQQRGIINIVTVSSLLWRCDTKNSYTKSACIYIFSLGRWWYKLCFFVSLHHLFFFFDEEKKTGSLLLATHSFLCLFFPFIMGVWLTWGWDTDAVNIRLALIIYYAGEKQQTIKYV